MAEVIDIQTSQCLEALPTIMYERPDKSAFCVLQLTKRRDFAGRHGPFLNSCLPDFGTDHVLGDLRPMGDPVGELVPGRGVWNSGSHREHLAEVLTPALVVGKI